MPLLSLCEPLSRVSDQSKQRGLGLSSSLHSPGSRMACAMALLELPGPEAQTRCWLGEQGRCSHWQLCMSEGRGGTGRAVTGKGRWKNHDLVGVGCGETKEGCFRGHQSTRPALPHPTLLEPHLPSRSPPFPPLLSHLLPGHPHSSHTVISQIRKRRVRGCPRSPQGPSQCPALTTLP